MKNDAKCYDMHGNKLRIWSLIGECVLFYWLTKEGYYGRVSSTVGTWRMLGGVSQDYRLWSSKCKETDELVMDEELSGHQWPRMKWSGGCLEIRIYQGGPLQSW